jgi:hypothetical protein
MNTASSGMGAGTFSDLAKTDSRDRSENPTKMIQMFSMIRQNFSACPNECRALNPKTWLCLQATETFQLISLFLKHYARYPAMTSSLAT